MNPENFAYWLQGLLELGDPQQLDAHQLDLIKKHLALVLQNKTKTSGPTTFAFTPAGDATLYC